jgi:hypothetical protein
VPVMMPPAGCDNDIVIGEPARNPFQFPPMDPTMNVRESEAFPPFASDTVSEAMKMPPSPKVNAPDA